MIKSFSARFYRLGWFGRYRLVEMVISASSIHEAVCSFHEFMRESESDICGSWSVMVLEEAEAY